MSKPDNVKIPLALFTRIIELLEYWDVATYAPDLHDDYINVYNALLKKRQRLELRDAYAKVIYAPNDDARHSARMHYLQQKRWVDDF